MPPTKNVSRTGANKATSSPKKFISKFIKNYVNFEFAKSLLFDVERLPIVSVLIILAELIINVFIIQRVPYTEIDWKAYMQECEGFLNGTTNYSLLRGDTGPLVYPAGFVYIYSALYFITSFGQNVRLAQYIFAGIYLLQMYLVLRLYTKSRKVPPYALIISAFTSYRIHSIYVLRLFNDPVAILFLYIALNCFCGRRWTLGSVFFSIAVSVKMNILLFAPALFLFYLTNLGYLKTIVQLAICGAIQLLLGAPFLLTYPMAYIKGSFDLGRVFEHKWTVNYRFLSETVFVNKYFHLSLLLVHIFLLAVFASPTFRFFQSYYRLRELEKQLQPQIDQENARRKKAPKPKKKTAAPNEEQLSAEQEQFLNSFEKTLQKSSGQTKSDKKLTEQEEEDTTKDHSIHFDRSIQLALLPLFLCNFIGIVCARSLHYQFYIWYFHSLPYLTWSTDFRVSYRILLLELIEFCWNTYPSTVFSSSLLHVCHLILLIGIGRNVFKAKSFGDKMKEQ